MSEGHIAGSKIIMILVEFQARMEAVLKDMRQLVERVDPDRAMDFSQFPEVDANEFLKTPLKPIPVPVPVPVPSGSGGLGSLLEQPLQPPPIKEPEQRLEPKCPPSMPRDIPTKPRSSLETVTTQHPEVETSKATGLKVRSDLTNQWGGIPNPAKDHPEAFQHMQQPTPPIPVKVSIDLGTPSDDPHVEDVIESDEEEYKTGSKTDSGGNAWLGGSFL